MAVPHNQQPVGHGWGEGGLFSGGGGLQSQHHRPLRQQRLQDLMGTVTRPPGARWPPQQSATAAGTDACVPSNFPLIPSPSLSTTPSLAITPSPPIYSPHSPQSSSPRVQSSSPFLRSEESLQRQQQQQQQQHYYYYHHHHHHHSQQQLSPAASPGRSVPSRDIDRDPLRRFPVKRGYHENENTHHHEAQTRTQAQALRRCPDLKEEAEEPSSPSAGAPISSQHYHHQQWLAASAGAVHSDKPHFLAQQQQQQNRQRRQQQQQPQQHRLEARGRSVRADPAPEIEAAIRSHSWPTSQPSERSSPGLGCNVSRGAVGGCERRVSAPCVPFHPAPASFCGRGHEAANSHRPHGHSHRDHHLGHAPTPSPSPTPGINCGSGGSGGSEHADAAYSLAASGSGGQQHHHSQQLCSGCCARDPASKSNYSGANQALYFAGHMSLLDSRSATRSSSSAFSCTDSSPPSSSDHESPRTPATAAPLLASAARWPLADPNPAPATLQKSAPHQTHAHGCRPQPHPQQPPSFPPVPAVTVPALPATAATSNVDCYTCRRRRVKCDRQLPLCAKCERTKLECLGYRKPLVWNKGVASRGKMMGKTFPTPSTTNTVATASKPPAKSISTTSPPTARTTAQRKKLLQQSKAVAISPPTLPTTPVSPVAPLTPVSIAAPRSPAKQKATAADDDDGNDDEDMVVVVSSCCCGPDTTVAGPKMQLLAATSEVGALPVELTLTLQIPPSQGSPFSQLNPEARYYMKYFDERVARDFVLFDRPPDNPYRSLMPEAAHNPALLNGILAVAARHHSNLTNTSVTKHLPYKGLSFNYLSQDLQRLGTKGILTEPTLAVVMLFIFFETLDGGLDTWKTHLRGARHLIQECQALDSLPENTSAMLRIFMNHVTLVDIIGRTLAFSTSSQPVVFDSEIPEYLAALQEGEAYNFLGCPAELLEAIHKATLLKPRARSIPAPEGSDFLSSAGQLLSRIESFSAAAYVATRGDIDPAVFPSLLHLVQVYRAAALVYANETLFPFTTTPDSTATYHAELRHHISALEDGSIFLKGAVWPVFVAGTGAHSQPERDWTRQQLDRLWEVLPQGNIKSARKVLEEIWMCGDSGGESGWRLLEKGGKDWLFV